MNIMLELNLFRRYYAQGTNGKLRLQQQHICYTIERPWLDNRRQLSCIPEGRYPIRPRYSPRYGWHYLVDEVKDRSLILIHPANNALQELQGCLAPVTSLSGEGLGLQSRKAFRKLKQILDPYFTRGESVYLTIQMED